MQTAHSYWMDARNLWRHLCAMPIIELTETELADAARGVRHLVSQSLEDAKRHSGSSAATLFLHAAEAHQELVEKLERARLSRNG